MHSLIDMKNERWPNTRLGRYQQAEKKKEKDRESS